MEDSRLVYSTGTGRVCPNCGRPRSKCVCRKKNQKAGYKQIGDDVIRIKREVKGRKGKTVTTISGFRDNDAELKRIAAGLKNRCGTGGSVKDAVVVLQGDHREAVRDELTKQGFKVLLAGG
jgi:translation initiation factor 1